VEDSGKTTLTLIEGDVLLSNEFGQVTLKNGEQGTVEAGQAPRKTAVIEAVNLIQWCLYYPGILDPASVRSSSGTASLAAYRQGSLLTALKLASAEKVSVNPEEAPYWAALLLSVGQVDKAEEVLRQAHANDPQSMALRQMIAAVKLRPLLPVPKPTTASEFLADSYYKQAFGDLQGARSSARETVRISPDFGFGWVRVAEMEFSFGEIGAARRAVERGLALSPLNAQAHSLLGFLASAQNETEEALTCFNRAIELDPALGNAWLGRGLCRIRQGDAEGGRKDLQLAAALEPNRSLLRSYLAKAFSNAGNLIKAKKELGLARLLDPLEPTPWLYQALLQQQQNRYNEAVGD
jgi:tetratricopeptide (TPR) repeat protein